jgi:hypothetical protein
MSGPSKKLAGAAEPVEAKVRSLIADGQRWFVREMPAPVFDRRGGVHLLFESDGVWRRLRTFPANWYDLPDAELYALTDRIRTAD